MSDPRNPYAPPPQDQRPDFNPYAPPGASIGATGSPGEGDLGHAESVRRELLSHEASVKSLGCLYYWSGILAAILASVVVLFGALGSAGLEEVAESGALIVGMGLGYGLLAWLNIWIGKGLRNLQSNVRLLLTVFLVIGLIGFPLGTLISGYFLWILHGEKGKRILTEEYRSIVAQTPHIQYRTPLWVWVFLALFALGIALAIGMAANTA